MTYHRYFDTRFGDLYEIYITPDGEFDTAVRNLDAVGRDPIVYSHITEIPQPQRNAIENILWKKTK